jgi:uncharacterized cofD-like protein
VSGIPKAIRQSSALKACFINLMSQPGETTSFTASDHIKAICDHAGEKLLDYAIVSTSRITPAVRRNYAEQNAAPIENDFEAIEELGLRVIKANLLLHGAKVRHDPAEAARVAIELAIHGRKRREDHEGATGSRSGVLATLNNGAELRY